MLFDDLNIRIGEGFCRDLGKLDKKRHAKGHIGGVEDSNRDGYLLELTEWTQGSQAS